MNNTKMRELENLRAISFIGVVLQHVLGIYVVQQGVSNSENIIIGLLFGLAKFAVPCFVFLSGILITKKYINKFNYLKFLKKNILKIVIPYAVFCGVYVIYYEKYDNLAEVFKNAIFGQVTYHTWYLAMIIGLYIIMPFLLFALHKVNKSGMSKIDTWKLIIFIFVTYSMILYIYPYFKNFTLTSFLFENATLNPLYYVPYFLIGGLFSLNYKENMQAIVHHKRYFIVIAYCAYLLSIYLLFSRGYSDGVLNLNFMPTLSISSALLSISWIFLLLIVSHILLSKEKLTKWLNFIAKHSFLAYLYHTIMIQFISNNTTFLPREIRFIIMFIGSVILSVLISYAYDMLKAFILSKFKKEEQVLKRAE